VTGKNIEGLSENSRGQTPIPKMAPAREDPERRLVDPGFFFMSELSNFFTKKLNSQARIASFIKTRGPGNLSW
jgi:hypothetical protein